MALLIGVGTALLWTNYHVSHVVSRTALVKGHVAELGTRFDGVVANVAVVAGESVVAGQVLARLDDRHLRAEADEADAEIASLQRKLDVENMNIEHDERRFNNRLHAAEANTAAADAEVAAARVEAGEASNFYNDRRSLLGTQAVSRESVRDADASRRGSLAMLNVAEANLTAARSAQQAAILAVDSLSIRRRELGVIEARISRAQARLALAKADLESALIRAPQAGTIHRVYLRTGSSVRVGNPVLALLVDGPRWVEAWIEQSQIGRVAAGQEATVSLHSYPGREFSATVAQVGLTTDYETPPDNDNWQGLSRLRGTPAVGVWLQLNETPPQLLPGLTAVVAIRSG